METKKWYESRTLWVNLISIVGVFVAQHFGITISAEQTVSILGGINVLLRFLTKKPVVFS